ncbi:MAG: hypothetical protein HRT63_07575 [Erythrobacter sp.]|nr:hypothetical protein [Erythrobacter sp.]
MDFGGPSFVIAIIALSMGGWIINNWIRAKHGYDLEDEWGGKTSKANPQANSAETERLKSENRELHDKLDAMQDRMIVLEKIVTDRGYSLADEIEALRDVPVKSGNAKSTSANADSPKMDSGVPLNIQTKEPQK